jgi:hypothetical protein
VQHGSAALRGGQRLRTPCAHRLGERTKRQRLGRATFTPRPVSKASWQSTLLSQSLGPAPRRPGLAAATAQDPTRLPRIRLWARPRTILFRGGSTTEGSAPAFRPLLARSTLLRRRRPTAPFRVAGLFRRSTLRLVGPRGLSSDTAPRCLESVSTTDVSRHEHPWQTSPLETFFRASWETRRRSISRSPFGARPAFGGAVSSGDAGPSCDHPASSGLALDGAMPASGPLAATVAPGGVGDKRRSFVGWRTLCRVEPSDTSRDDRVCRAGAPQGLRRASPFPPEHVNASDLPELEVPSTEEGRARSLSRAREV